ncbi:MAG: site-2 protease family protein [Solirubrobacterales bacterium]|nr:site-2 protease family protein [Solirubrobacterales bacterium]
MLAVALAILGVMVLVVLHELGHFFAAKAVGMRVEKLYLFFGPKIFSVTRGETEYGIGTIPAGGYAKITGMNPDEELPPEVAPRGYYNQPVWKRIVVILAGPLVNLVVAFVVLFGTAFAAEEPTELAVSAIAPNTPAEAQLEDGDRVVSVDGFDGAGLPLTERALGFQERVDSHECPGTPSDGCRAEDPVEFVVERDGETLPLEIRPFFDGELDRNRLGFSFAETEFVAVNRSIGEAAGSSLDTIWFISSETVSTFAQLFKASEREKLGSVVGAVEVTRRAFQFDFITALKLIGFISLSLALVNLLPFLPLDGGHVFWGIVEKLRGKRVPFAVMERASVIGFALVMGIFFIGLWNDVGRFQDGSFDIF